MLIFVRLFVHLVQTCLELTIVIIWAQNRRDNFKMTQRAFSKNSESTQNALRKQDSNKTLSYHWSLIYFVLLILWLQLKLMECYCFSACRTSFSEPKMLLLVLFCCVTSVTPRAHMICSQEHEEELSHSHQQVIAVPVLRH